MPRGNRIQTLLIGLIILQTALLLGRSWPTAQAEEAQTEEEETAPLQALEAPPMDLVCRYFELDESSLRGDAHGEINTQNPTGDLEKFLKGDYAGMEPFSMDFETGQSLSGKPTYWVQVCLRSR